MSLEPNAACHATHLRSPNCICGGYGWSVGRFYAILPDGIVFQPTGTSVTTYDQRGLPIWDPITLWGVPMRNTEHLWFCGHEMKTFETTLALPETCEGLGVDDIGHKGGLCSDTTARQG